MNYEDWLVGIDVILTITEVIVLDVVVFGELLVGVLSWCVDVDIRSSKCCIL